MAPQTKIGRVCFLVMVVGLILVVIAIWGHVYHMQWERLPSDLWGLFWGDNTHGHWQYSAARIGGAMAVLGYICAYHWQRTIGRVIGWVRAGS